jgi:hypothetical protein
VRCRRDRAADRRRKSRELWAADGSKPEHLSQKIACGDVTNPARYVAASQGCPGPQSTWKTHRDDRGLIKASLSGARATVATRLWRDRVPIREQERNEALASARIAEERVALLSLEASPTGSGHGHDPQQERGREACPPD